MASRAKAVKITINVDTDSLAALKEEAQRTGVPYQRLLNQVLRDGLVRRVSAEERLARLERDVARIKKRRVA